MPGSAVAWIDLPAPRRRARPLGARERSVRPGSTSSTDASGTTHSPPSKHHPRCRGLSARFGQQRPPCGVGRAVDSPSAHPRQTQSPRRDPGLPPPFDMVRTWRPGTGPIGMLQMTDRRVPFGAEDTPARGRRRPRRTRALASALSTSSSTSAPETTACCRSGCRAGRCRWTRLGAEHQPCRDMLDASTMRCSRQEQHHCLAKDSRVRAGRRRWVTAPGRVAPPCERKVDPDGVCSCSGATPRPAAEPSPVPPQEHARKASLISWSRLGLVRSFVLLSGRLLHHVVRLDDAGTGSRRPQRSGSVTAR